MFIFIGIYFDGLLEICCCEEVFFILFYYRWWVGVSIFNEGSFRVIVFRLKVYCDLFIIYMYIILFFF